MLCNQQVAGAGDRQELRDAFDDSQQNDLQQIIHRVSPAN